METTKEKRFHDAFICFEELLLSLRSIKNQPPAWGDYERDNDPRILNKIPFMVNRRFFGFATEDTDITSSSRIGKTFLVLWIRLPVPRNSILLLDARTQSDQEKVLELINSSWSLGLIHVHAWLVEG
jgi:hypothetical protein